MLFPNPRPQHVTRADIERILEQLETADLEAVNLVRSYIRGLEGLALAGELLEEEISDTWLVESE